MCRPAPVGVGPTLCPSLTLWERALPAKTSSQAPHLPNCAPPIRTPSRAEPAPTITGSCMDLCQVQPMSRPALVGVDLTPCPSLTLWERALPAKTYSQSPPFPSCASPIRTPSRAEPAPTITGAAWIYAKCNKSPTKAPAQTCARNQSGHDKPHRGPPIPTPYTNQHPPHCRHPPTTPAA